MKLDTEMIFILGRPNWWCVPYANRLRELGHKCNRKAEHEQALVIYVMIEFYKEHGINWRSNFFDYLNSDNHVEFDQLLNIETE